MAPSRESLLPEGHGHPLCPNPAVLIPPGTAWHRVMESWAELARCLRGSSWTISGDALGLLRTVQLPEQAFSVGFSMSPSAALVRLHCVKKDEWSVSCVAVATQVLLLHLVVVGARPLLQALPLHLQLAETRRGFSSCVSCSRRG